MPNTLAVIQASYSKVGPTSVSDSSVAMKKRIQNRVFQESRIANPLKGATVLWGLKSTYRQSNRGDGSQNTKFSGIFPRMSF
mgnify:CR=1 FL=1